MKEVDFKTYKSLAENKSVPISSIPKGVFNSKNFKSLLSAKILKKQRAGRGFKIEIFKKPEFDEFFNTFFPEQSVSRSKSGNIKKYRNSKATKVDISPIFLLRGFKSFQINQQLVDLKSHTQNFGLLGIIPESISTDKICFVENLEPFLNAEKLLGSKYLFAHKYGRIGKDSLTMIQTKEVLVFVDYDFNGLDEYLRIKGVFKNARLFIPNNFRELFEKYSLSLSGNKTKMSKAVKNSKDVDVIRIREQIIRINRFLEQEVLINV